ncbi:MAG: glycerophosphodiester phosphodiesterase family protein [Acidimicrobiales bacterium]
MERFAFLAEATPFGLAHRGGNEVAAENTVAAFEHAVSLGFDHLETDVHCTLDGVLVAFHDAGLERVAGLPGTIADHTWATLSQVEIGDGQRIPTMASLLETFPTTRFNIDPKADAAVEPLIKLLRLHEAIDRVCIGSFSDDRIGRLSAALGPGLCTSAGPRHIAALWAAAHTSRAIGAVARSGPVRRIAEQHGCLQVPPIIKGVRLAEAPLIDLAHQLGLQVHVWTINDESTMRSLFDAGVDALVSDKLSVLRRVLDERAT